MNPHLCEYNESERADYMVVIASLAGVDGDLTSEEVLALRELCLHFVLGPEARGRVMAATVVASQELEGVLERLARSAMRYSLVVDLCTMAYRDGVFSEAEEAEIRRLGGRLGIESGALTALLAFAAAVHKPQAPDLESALGELEKAGVPRAAVGLSATLYGLARAGRVPELETRV